MKKIFDWVDKGLTLTKYVSWAASILKHAKKSYYEIVEGNKQNLKEHED